MAFIVIQEKFWKATEKMPSSHYWRSRSVHGSIPHHDRQKRSSWGTEGRTGTIGGEQDLLPWKRIAWLTLVQERFWELDWKRCPPHGRFLLCQQQENPKKARRTGVWYAVRAFSVNWSLSNLVAFLRWNLFTYRDLWEWIDKPFDIHPFQEESVQYHLWAPALGQHP